MSLSQKEYEVWAQHMFESSVETTKDRYEQEGHLQPDACVFGIKNIYPVAIGEICFEGFQKGPLVMAAISSRCDQARKNSDKILAITFSYEGKCVEHEAANDQMLAYPATRNDKNDCIVTAYSTRHKTIAIYTPFSKTFTRIKWDRPRQLEGEKCAKVLFGLRSLFPPAFLQSSI